MSKEFKDLNSLFKYIEKNVVEIMKSEVSEAVKDEQQRQINEIVYKAYSPFVYERRNWYEGDGGLADREVMVAEVGKTKDGIVLSVINLAKGQDQEHLYIAPLVEYGHDNGHGEYQYPYNRDNTEWKFLQARPFTKETIDALKRSGLHVEVLKQELNRRGIKTIDG